jgi:hypothetical protein
VLWRLQRWATRTDDPAHNGAQHTIMTAERTLVTMLLAIVAAVFVYVATRNDVDCRKPWPQQITRRTYPWHGNIYLQCLMR